MLFRSEEIVNKINNIVEKIVPILIPFIRIILPIVIIIGSFLRTVIGDYLFPLFPLFPDSKIYTFWIISGSLILIIALFFLIKMPERENVKE